MTVTTPFICIGSRARRCTLARGGGALAAVPGATAAAVPGAAGAAVPGAAGATVHFIPWGGAGARGDSARGGARGAGARGGARGGGEVVGGLWTGGGVPPCAIPRSIALKFSRFSRPICPNTPGCQPPPAVNVPKLAITAIIALSYFSFRA